jgi:hypothetical protein
MSKANPPRHVGFTLNAKSSIHQQAKAHQHAGADRDVQFNQPKSWAQEGHAHDALDRQHQQDRYAGGVERVRSSKVAVKRANQRSGDAAG